MEKSLNISLQFFILFLSFCISPVINSPPDLTYIKLCLLILVITLVMHLHLQWQEKNWFRFDVFFLLGFLIVHFQWPMMYAISDISPNGVSRVWDGIDYMNYGTWLSLVGVQSWIFGYSLLQKSRIKKIEVREYLPYKKLFIFSLFFFLLFVFFAGNEFLSGARYTGEIEHDTSGMADYFRLFSEISFLVLTAVILNNSIQIRSSSFRCWLKKLNKYYIIYFIFYNSVYLISGDRGALIQSFLSILILYGVLVAPISFKKLAILTFLGAVFLTVIGLGRGQVGGNLIAAGLSSLTITSGYDLTLELANSVRVLYKSIDLATYQDVLFLGKLWTSKIMSIVPFSQNILLELTDIQVHELGSAGYITYETFGQNAPMGEGTTLVADILLNFGTIGVVLFLFLFGVVSNYIVKGIGRSRSFIYVIILVILAGESLYFGRGSLFGPFRSIIWGCLLYYFLVWKQYKFINLQTSKHLSHNEKQR